MHTEKQSRKGEADFPLSTIYFSALYGSIHYSIATLEDDKSQKAMRKQKHRTPRDSTLTKQSPEKALIAHLSETPRPQPSAMQENYLQDLEEESSSGQLFKKTVREHLQIELRNFAEIYLEVIKAVCLAFPMIWR